MSKQFERGPWRAVHNGRRMVYTDGRSIVSADYADEMAELTRMPDAECAAEYWRNLYEYLSMFNGYSWPDMTGGWARTQSDASRRSTILRRFAENPHAHDA